MPILSAAHGKCYISFLLCAQEGKILLKDVFLCIVMHYIFKSSLILHKSFTGTSK